MNKPLPKCIVCGGKLRRDNCSTAYQWWHICTCCGLAYARLPERPVCPRPILYAMTEVREKVAGCLKHLLRVLDIVTPPEEKLDGKAAEKRDGERDH